ncbi:MAG: NADH-quinone oxidoreductase subunit C [Myxococcales bacterium]|jgi:NADH-quinone oxidoreductase subunit C|nr:NADH-quinone oxidoreductase subunit C [Myxococcales bacterium]
MSKVVLDVLKQRFGDAVLETHAQFGDETAVLSPDVWFDAARFLKTDPRTSMTQFIDLTAVDYPDRDPRFEVVMHLRSLEKGHRVRLKARVGDPYSAEGLEIDSITPVWGGANWFEREAFDMFGVVFRGHPDLRRILMYPEFKGHALRKDYPANKIQPLVEYRAVPDKLPPFGPDEGMSFGRQTHEYHRDDPVMIGARQGLGTELPAIERALKKGS